MRVHERKAVMARSVPFSMLLVAAHATAVAAEQGSPRSSPGTAESVDVVGPGGGLTVLEEVVVAGAGERDVERTTSQVVSLLSSEDIARTGEGDIAGALARISGLSVVGGGFVYVRGLGDRYSLALLNGSPLPSPEPLRRAVPLDLFPTDVIASSLIQKTYSPNYPGEFGGGVINLTTLAIPARAFFNISGGVGGDSETTNHLGYDYYGSRTDWTGFDNGNRDLPPALRAFFDSGARVSAGGVDTGAIAKEFVGWHNGLLQKIDGAPVNYSTSASTGDSWNIGDSALGVIATAGFSNKWRTRDNIEQSPGSFDLSVIDKDYRSVATENRVVANGLLGLGLEFGEGSRLRWTNMYVHDTLKRASLAEGRQNSQKPGVDFREQKTGWYERQLLTTQIAGNFDLEPVSLGVRGSYSRSKRDAPYELGIGYSRSNVAASPFGDYYINRLDNGQTGFANIAFSQLEEGLWSGGVDVTWKMGPRFALSAGYDFAETDRQSKRREFQIVAPSTLPSEVAMLRPDFLLGPAVIEYYDIGLVETTESDPAFSARLRTHAAYAQLQTRLTDALELSAGARFERGMQFVHPAQVFTTLTNSGASTRIDNGYVLPAATLTWRFMDQMQLRFNASRTVARPQFRELMFQAYYDPESNRSYRGNPLLADSRFTNGEARYEWYYAPDQRVSVAGFYKHIDRPIEAYTGFNDNTPVTSFANAPRARLYGAELELQQYFPLDALSGDDGFWSRLAARRLVLIGNYTYTQSRIKVRPEDNVDVYGSTVTRRPAGDYFLDGGRLTGQSDHLVNLQVGLEHPSRLSQQTLLLSYASDRVTSRGAANLPDIFESPGLRLDLVARQGLDLFSRPLEFKLEVRNVLSRGYREFQRRGGNVVYYNRYDMGVNYALSVSTNF
ncbi:MAG TPA: TonB-dependent receptor [Luteimonas sp.]|nr:TonB-dependent receptor [Luteimonas sp.]